MTEKTGHGDGYLPLKTDHYFDYGADRAGFLQAGERHQPHIGGSRQGHLSMGRGFQDDGVWLRFLLVEGRG